VVENAADVNGEIADPAEDEVRIIGIPTSVELLYFRASARQDNVLLEWETASETDVWGYKLFRNTTMSYEGAELIHTELSAGGNLSGHYYAYEDADVELGHTYYYWLVYQLEGDPSNTLFVSDGPVMAIAGGGYRIFLPIISRE
jgi:hypothetical protein